MTKLERIQLLRDAEDHLYEAINGIREALKGTSHERSAEYYILGHLQNWVDASGSLDMGIQQYVDDIYNEEDEEELED